MFSINDSTNKNKSLFDYANEEEAMKNQDDLYEIIERNLQGIVFINLIKVLCSHNPNERKNITYAVNEFKRLTSVTHANNQNNILNDIVHIYSNKIDVMSKNIEDIKVLASITEFRNNKMPLTFVLKPKPIYEGDGIFGSLNKNVNKIVSLLWDEVCIYFYCPITKKIVNCGNNGNGYYGPIKIPKDILRKITPCLKLGLLFLSVAVSATGIDISDLIPTCKDQYYSHLINDITKAFSSEELSFELMLEKLNTLLDQNHEEACKCSIIIIIFVIL